ncbi:MAG TPA: hypothetical protein VI455_02380 [Terriglobia bacterium]
MLVALALLAKPAASSAQFAVGVSVTIAPPALPVYVQPPCPSAGYMWTPGYWAYDPADGYYWVPGTWVLAPQAGLLWTPGYWGWGGAAFLWHAGYWGPHVGFYGGINYGFGYLGVGYLGGYWNNGNFFYNRAVNNISTTNITNVYNKTVINNVTVNRVSYNGGNGGIAAQPTATELAATRDRHVEATSAQAQQVRAAHSDRALLASANHGQPPIAATPKPGAFNDPGVVRASRAGAPYHPEPNRPVAANRPAAADRAPAAARTPNPGGGGARPLITAHPNPSAQANPHPASPAHTGATAARPTYNAGANRNTPPAQSAHRPQTVPHTPASYQHTPRPESRHTEAPHTQSTPKVQHEAAPHAAAPQKPKPQLKSSPHQGDAPREGEKRPPE